MVAYLKWIDQPDDEVSLLRVINTPVRGIGKTTVETLLDLAAEREVSVWSVIGSVLEGETLALRGARR